MKFKVGFSTCPNDTFIFDAIVNKKIDTNGFDFDFVLADVEELNKMAFNQELDVTKISFFAYAFVSEYYQVLNSGAALGYKNGPLLIAKNNLNLNDYIEYRIAIPGKYTTANLLFSIAFPNHKNKEELLFSEIEDAVCNNTVDAGLIIHENRFTYQLKGLQKLVDLGEFWENKTQMPIPLGGIIIKRDIDHEMLQKFDNLLQKSIRYAFRNPNSAYPYMQKYAQEMSKEVMYKHVGLYVNDFTLYIGSEGKKAVNVLYKNAIETGLIKRVVKPIFV